MKEKTSLKDFFRLIAAVYNWAIFVYFTFGIINECFHAAKVTKGKGNANMLIGAEHSVISNALDMRNHSLSLIPSVIVVIAVVIFAVVMIVVWKKDSFIAAGVGNFVYAVLFLIVYSHWLFKFPDYGFSAGYLSIVDPRPYLNRILIMVMMLLISFVISVVYFAVKLKNHNRNT